MHYLSTHGKTLNMPKLVDRATHKRQLVTQFELQETLQKKVLDTIVTAPLGFGVRCRSRAAGRGVALTTESVGRRGDHGSRLGVAFGTGVVREGCNSGVTHKLLMSVFTVPSPLILSSRIGSVLGNRSSGESGQQKTLVDCLQKALY